jgi:hypothetical protein
MEDREMTILISTASGRVQKAELQADGTMSEAEYNRLCKLLHIDTLFIEPVKGAPARLDVVDTDGQRVVELRRVW